MAEIVLIHGIGAQDASALTLMGTWLPALAGGITNAGYPDIAASILGGKITVAMAFYGDLFLPPAVLNQAAVSPGPDAGDGGAPATAGQTQRIQADPFTESLAEEIVRRAANPIRHTPDTPAAAGAVAAADAPKTAGGSGAPLGPGLQNYFLQELDKLTWIKKRIFGIAEDTVVPALKQVGIYLDDPTIHDDVQQIVAELVGDDTRVIIGHSLGSVVAYNFAVSGLKQELPLLLTLGSPLGDQTLVYNRLEPRPPEYPPLVKQWVNISAHNDPVAANPNLVPDFGDIPQGCQLNSGWTVYNLAGGAHAIVDYLNQEQVGSTVARVFAGVTAATAAPAAPATPTT